MARKDAKTALLDQLSALNRAGDVEALKPVLIRALADSLAYLVQRAAVVIGEREIRELLPNVAESLERWFGGGDDRGCDAKTALTQTLCDLSGNFPELLLRAARHKQYERQADGKTVDVAAAMRGLAGIAYAKLGRPDAIYLLTELLFDLEMSPRAAAARALGAIRVSMTWCLLHARLLAEERDPEVLAETFSSMLAVDTPRTLPVLEFMARDPVDESVAAAAALALGESRAESAVAFLAELTRRESRGTVRKNVWLALALHRSPAARRVLIDATQSPTNATIGEMFAAIEFAMRDGEFRSHLENRVSSWTDRGAISVVRGLLAAG